MMNKYLKIRRFFLNQGNQGDLKKTGKIKEILKIRRVGASADWEICCLTDVKLDWTSGSTIRPPEVKS